MAPSDPPSRFEIDEYRYLRREMVLREGIQAACLTLQAVFAGLAVASAMFLQHPGPITGFLLLSCGLAGVWGHNDNLQVRIGVYLVRLEEDLGIGWEAWLASKQSRMLGPISSGHQVTTRGYFLLSELFAMGIGTGTEPDSRTWELWAGLFVVTVIVLVKAKVVADT